MNPSTPDQNTANNTTLESSSNTNTTDSPQQHTINTTTTNDGTVTNPSSKKFKK